jgi:hypothetical protein
LTEHAQEFALFCDEQLAGYFSSEHEARVMAQHKGYEIFFVRRVCRQASDRETMLGIYGNVSSAADTPSKPYI